MLPARLPPFLFACPLLAGLGAGVGLRWLAGVPGGAPLAEDAPGQLAEAVAATPNHALAGPFSMDRFHALQGWEMHRMLAQVLPGADAALVRALADELFQREPILEPNPERQGEWAGKWLVVWQAVFARWMQLEAPAAMTWARGHHLRATAMEAWVEIDVEAVMAATELSAPLLEWRVILTKLSKSDPWRAMQLHQQFDRQGRSAGGRTDGLFGVSLLQQLAERDPPAALLALQTHFQNGYEPVRALASGWAAKDTAACYAWIAQLPPNLKNPALVGLGEVAAQSPAKIAAVLTNLPLDGSLRGTCLSVAKQWAEKEPAAALAWVRIRFPEGRQRADALRTMANVLMETNLPAAVRLMDEAGWKGEPPGSSRQILPAEDGQADKNLRTGGDPFDPFSGNLLVGLLDRLANVDPLQARQAWEKIPATEQSDLAECITLPWFRKDPEAALAWLGGLPAGKVHPSDLRNIISELAGVDAAARKEWALRLPPGPLQQAFVETVTNDMVEKAARGGAAALAAAAGAIPFTEAGSRQVALQALVEKWGELDPVPALGCLLREARPAPETCEAVLQSWSARDATAASEWVATQPPGPNRDGAIKGLFNSLTNAYLQPDYPAALAWGLALSDPIRRLEAAQFIFKNPPLAADVAELRATLNQTTALPETERSALLEKLPP